MIASLGLVATLTASVQASSHEATPSAPRAGNGWDGDWPHPGGRPPEHGKHSALPPRANGLWMYDTIHPGLDSSDRVNLPGMWAPRINQYNRKATAGHTMTRIYSFASSMEMYCPDRDPAKCALDDLKIYYSPQSSGHKSTEAYDRGVERVGGSEVVISPVVDARIGASYFSGFNDLSPRLARQYADKVTKRLCADRRIDGVQFDLEPFDVSTKNGQYHFYQQIAKNFAGENRRKNFHCVGRGHPEGRFFSIFAFAEVLRSGTSSAENLAEVLTRYDNGYMIQSLYDLIQTPAGNLNPAPDYAEQAQQEVENMRSWADELDVPYSIGIPGAATAHEYTTCDGPACKPAPNGATGYPMLEYTKAALAAIDAHDVRNDPLFLGTDVWYLGASHYRDGYMRQPVPVPTTVWDYLAENL